MLVVEGSPALVNILKGILAVFLFERAVKHKPAMPYFLNQFSLFMNNSKRQNHDRTLFYYPRRKIPAW